MILRQAKTDKWRIYMVDTGYNTIATFTCNSAQEIIDCGGDYDWVLDPQRAKRCQFLLCVSSQHPNHRTGFLLGKVSGVEESKKEAGKSRYRINVSEVAKVNIPNINFKFLNPVKYLDLRDLDIDLSTIHFEKVDKPQTLLQNIQPASITIKEAKEALARYYHVEEENIKIEIVISE